MSDFKVGDRVSLFTGHGANRSFSGTDTLRKRHKNGNWLLTQDARQWRPSSGGYLTVVQPRDSWFGSIDAWPTDGERARELRLEAERNRLRRELPHSQWWDNLTLEDLKAIADIFRAAAGRMA